jgi:rare lipoprotein A
MRFLFFIICFFYVISGWAKPKKWRVETGMASYYADKFHGRRTSNGERFNMYAYTAAHRTHPFNTMLKVTLLESGKSVIVRVNDRGPHARRRIVDLSKRAAADIGLIKHGSGKVKVEVVGKDGKVAIEKEPKPKKGGKPAPPAPVVIKASPKKGTTTAASDKTLATGKTYSMWGTEKKPHGFGIQISAYDDLEIAKNDCKALKAKGVEDSYIQVGWAGGAKTYRVLLGEYARREHADADLKKYKKMGYDGFIKKHL